MSAVSHFQRFAQRENHVTNNTLLVLRHLYQISPAKLEAVLHSLLGDTQVELGVQFDQQITGSESVPDALIYQRAWRVYVETKVGPALDDDQIERHVASIAATKDDGVAVLLGLTSGDVAGPQSEALAKMARQSNITFKWITFVELVEALQQQCAEYETTLTAIVEDYVDYLRSQGLLDARDDWILVVPCGQSYEENRRFGLYYDGVNRPSRNGRRYLGIYKDKAVSLIGDIVAVLVCSYAEGQVIVDAIEFGDKSPEYVASIKSVIEETKYYDLKSATHRYFVTSGLHETAIRKSTPSGIQGPRYLKISDLIGRRAKGLSTEQLAETLKGTTFPVKGNA